MRKRSSKRVTAPAKGVVTLEHEKVNKAIDLIRRIIFYAGGNKLSIEGMNVTRLWQAVPGYSDAVYFLPADYEKSSLHYMVRCVDPVDLTIRKIDGKVSDIKITTKGNLCAKEEVVSVLYSKPLRKMKTLDLVLSNQ